MKVILTNILLILCLNQTLFAQDSSSSQPGCSLIDKRRDPLFITYERIDDPDPKREGIDRDRVLVRIHNNSNCAVIIKTTDAKKFVINPSAAFTPQNIRHDFLDGEFVPEVTFFTQEGMKAPKPAYGGDFFFAFNLLGGRSILFAIPVEYLRRGYDIVVEFKFGWEEASDRPQFRLSGDVKHRVYFYGGSIPDEIKRKIRAR